jgi:hypothetical protein
MGGVVYEREICLDYEVGIVPWGTLRPAGAEDIGLCNAVERIFEHCFSQRFIGESIVFLLDEGGCNFVCNYFKIDTLHPCDAVDHQF